MISHKHQCIFIHIPKCAGTSIENVLGHFDGHEGRRGQDHRSIRMLQNPWISSKVLTSKENIKDGIRRLREGFKKPANPNNALTVTADQYRSYYKFTLVRNPWARAFSWYQNAMRDPIHQKNYKITADMPFNAFMRDFVGRGFLRPQTYWLKDYDGNIDMDFVGKFETLASDFDQIRQNLRLEEASLPHKIEGAKKDYRAEYDKDTRQLVEDFYAEEIRLFGYQFDH